MQQTLVLLKKYKTIIFLGLFLCFFLFLRLYQIELRNQFTWDQIDNAWAAKKIVLDHNFPLLGMQAQAREKTGYYIGPLYYYYVALFYLIFSLDPIASGVIAGISSLISLVVIFLVAERLFSRKAAIFATVIQTLSWSAIRFDRVQWPVQFVPTLTLLAVFVLYKIMTGNSKYIPFLAVILGLAFHIHFTLIIFLPILILFSLPFFPRTKETIKNSFIGIGIFVFFLIPNIISEITTKNKHISNLSVFLHSAFHGFHLRRVLQVVQDAFIQFEEILVFPVLKPLKFILLPATIFITFFKFSRKKWFILSYLFSLCFLIPWIIFAMYSGEISDYYFAFNRYIAAGIIGYLLGELFSIKYKNLSFVPQVAVLCIVCLFGFLNLLSFLQEKPNGDIPENKKIVMKELDKAGYIPYSPDEITSYLFVAYSWEKFQRRPY